MDAPEGSVNRIGRTIWTVWGYLSGAVARYLRPEVTDEGNQSVPSRSDDIDLKSTANKINIAVKADNNEKEDKKYNQNDKSIAEVKCSPPEVRVQVASVPWENADVVKDDNNDELNVETARKQTCKAVWSTEIDDGERDSGDSKSKSDKQVEKKAVLSDEDEKVNSNIESKETELAQELDETEQSEQKHGEECDQKREDDKCAKKREYPDNTDATVQSELYEQDVELEKRMDHGEKEWTGGFKNADECRTDENWRKEKTEIGEDQRTQSQVQDLFPELECSPEEVVGLSKLEGLKVVGKYSDEIAELSKNEVEMIPGTRSETESKQDTIKSGLLESVETLWRVSKEKSEKNLSNNEAELKMTSVLDEFSETVNASEDNLELDLKLEETLNERCVEEQETLDTDVVKTALEYVEEITNEVLKEMIDTENNLVQETEALARLSEEDLGEAENQGSEECVSVSAFVLEEETKGTMFSDLNVSEFPGELRKGPEAALAEPALGCFEEIKTYLHETQNLAEEQTERETFVAYSVGHPKTQKAVEETVEIEQDIETSIESLGASESQAHQETDKTKFPLKKHGELRTEPIVETTETKISSVDEEAEPCEPQNRSSNIRNVTFHELVQFTERETIDTISESLENAIVSEITGFKEIEHVAENQTDVKPVFTRTLSPVEFLEETVDLQDQYERCIEEQETLDTDVLKTALEYAEEITNQVLKEMIDTENNLVQETEALAGLSEEELGDAENQGPEECVSVSAFVLEEETEGMMFSDLMVSEFPGELRKGPETALAEPALGCFEEIKTYLHETQNLAEEQTERETFVAYSVGHPKTQKAVEETVEIEQDIETSIESLGASESQAHQETDITKFPLKEHGELRTEPIVETTETKISSVDEEAEPCETQNQSSNIRNVTFHELVQFTERETIDTGFEEIEHVAENQTDVKPVLIRTLSPAEFLEETVDLQDQYEQCIEEQETLDTDVLKTALEYVEEITNQVLKEMIETENNLVQETETLAGLSSKDHGDAEYQGPEKCVSVVLEEEIKLFADTMGSMVEMELETASVEVAKQNEQHISSRCETSEADGHHEQETVETDYEVSISCDAGSEGHVENEEVSFDEGQAERVHANSECKETETAQELDETELSEQMVDNDEEWDQSHENETCSEKREDPDNTDVRSELYGHDVDQGTLINIMEHGETVNIGGFKHAHLLGKEKNIVDQNDQTDEDQEPELQVPGDAFVLEGGMKLLGETMDSGIELEVENASSEVVKQNELQNTSECEADGRHEQIQRVSAAETVLSSHEDFMESRRPTMKRGFDQVSKELPEEKKFDLKLQAFENSSLDFTIQKSRIAVKNPLVRPPKDPRKLLYKVSVEPLLPPPPVCAPKAEVSVPSKGVLGFKLPGLGAGLPVLRKTEFGKKAREEGEAERTLHPQQKSVAVTEDSVKQEQASAKPKWTPPKHPGMGGPLMMAELKSKLKKPVKE